MAEAIAHASPAPGSVRERLSVVLRNGKSARIAKQQRGASRLSKPAKASEANGLIHHGDRDSAEKRWSTSS